MKKIFTISALLSVFIMLFGLAACSTSTNSGGSGSGGSSTGSGGGSGPKEIAAFKSHEDIVTVYDDNTWISTMIADSKSYSRGTYVVQSGDLNNGDITLTVTWSISNYVSTGDYGVRIKDGEFYFCFSKYKRIR